MTFLIMALALYGAGTIAYQMAGIAIQAVKTKRAKHANTSKKEGNSMKEAIVWCDTCEVEVITTDALAFCETHKHDVSALRGMEIIMVVGSYSQDAYAANRARHDRAFNEWHRGVPA